jgi:hydrogenase nickel incorporation protein HypA/HybF
MHEYSIASALLELVDEQARRHAAARILTVQVGVGELAGVEPELLRQAFELARERTICAGASLEIRRVPARWICRDCGASVPAGLALRCAACAGPARLCEGAELLLERVEMEVA